MVSLPTFVSDFQFAIFLSPSSCLFYLRFNFDKCIILETQKSELKLR